MCIAVASVVVRSVNGAVALDGLPVESDSEFSIPDGAGNVDHEGSDGRAARNIETKAVEALPEGRLLEGVVRDGITLGDMGKDCACSAMDRLG